MANFAGLRNSGVFGDPGPGVHQAVLIVDPAFTIVAERQLVFYPASEAASADIGKIL